jgi:hypothetical protein
VKERALWGIQAWKRKGIVGRKERCGDPSVEEKGHCGKAHPPGEAESEGKSAVGDPSLEEKRQRALWEGCKPGSGIKQGWIRSESTMPST